MFSAGNQPSQSLVLAVIFVQASTPGRFQTSKEALSSPTLFVMLSQTPDFQQESQLLTELPLAKIEKMFEDSTYTTGGKAALWAQSLGLCTGWDLVSRVYGGFRLDTLASVSPVKLFIVMSVL